MKTLTAIYKEERNGSMKDMVREYKTKAQFTEDLRGNGFRVLAVLTESDINEIKKMDFAEMVNSNITENVYEYCQQVL